jgi:hypothetical protein
VKCLRGLPQWICRTKIADSRKTYPVIGEIKGVRICNDTVFPGRTPLSLCLTSACYHPLGAADLDSYTVVQLSHLCDQKHRLVARLRLRQRPIARLEIAIKFSNTHVGLSTVLMSAQPFPAVKALLNPFRRLCRVDKPHVISITINDHQNREMNVFCLAGWPLK